LLEEVADSFAVEFDKLAEPFRKAIIESYDEGIKETGIILDKIKGGK